jgi:hypothetical protein
VTATLIVGGRLASEYGPHSTPTYETLADGGMGEASWEWRLPAAHSVRRGALAQMLVHGHPVWLGRVETIDGGAVNARGIWADGDTIPAVDGLWAATRNVGDAIETARDVPFEWAVTNRRGLSGTVPGTLDEPLMMTDLLRQRAAELGQRAGVDARGDLYLRADGTAPRWIIDARGADLGGSDAETYTMLLGRYRTTTGGRATALATHGRVPTRAAITDLTGYGGITSGQASTVLTNALNLLADQATWTQALEVHVSQIRTTGGQQANPAAILGGDRARIMSLTAAQQATYGAPTIDVTLGSVTQTPGSPMLTLAPVGTTAQSVEEAIEEAAR